MDALTTRLDAAAERVAEERCAVVAERDALDEFVGRVEDLGPTGADRPLADGGVRTGPSSPGPVLGAAPGSEGPDELGAVREAFVDLVVPTVPDHVEGDSPAAVLRDGLGPEVAGALAAEGPLTPPVRAGLRESVAERRRELDATEVVLDRERDQLAAVRGTVSGTVEWLRAADETPLSELGFDALRGRHDRLAEVRSECDDLVRERQTFLEGTTGRDGCRVSHDPFFAYLYGESETPDADFPALATLADLAALVEDCQRAVRAHLARRG
jgi:hypothetical protein